MLSECDMSPVLAVKDLQKGKEFYSQTLGLEVEKEDDDMILFSSGDTLLQVYQSQYAGTNQATAATWEVEDIEDCVTELKDKGVTFEQYDLPGASRNGDIHTYGNDRAAWFKDPDGNILCLHETG